MQSIALLPLIGLLTLSVANTAGRERHLRAGMFAFAIAAILALWFSTAYYLPWFTLYFAIIFAGCWLVTAPGPVGGRVKGWIARYWRSAAIGGISLLILLLPFLSVYLRKAIETGAHPYVAARHYLVTPVDPFNVGAGNLIWGWVFGGLKAALTAIRPGKPDLAADTLGGEHETGFPFVLFGLFIWAVIRTLRKDAPDNTSSRRTLAWAILVSWALTVKIGKFSLWWLVFHVIPGAVGLRVVLRYQIFLVLPILLLVFLTFRQAIAEWTKKRRLLLAGLGGLLIVEQLSSEAVARLNRADQRRDLYSVPAPPPACRSFYVVVARALEPFYVTPELNSLYPHNVDAMFLAQYFAIPTINGFSTFNPPDWDFASPLTPDYETRVARYAARHQLRGLCRLDMRNGRPWTITR